MGERLKPPDCKSGAEKQRWFESNLLHQYTENEMKQKKRELPKARNPFVQHLAKRPSGAHGKSYKTERRDSKVALKKSVDYSDKLVFL